MSIRLALCLLLLCASLPLVARDMPLLSAHDSGCTDDTATQDDDVAVRPASTEPATHTVKPVKAQPGVRHGGDNVGERSEEHTSELQSLMRISYAVFCLKKKHKHKHM